MRVRFQLDIWIAFFDQLQYPVLLPQMIGPE